jgi:hypothetical protein
VTPQSIGRLVSPLDQPPPQAAGKKRGRPRKVQPGTAG